MSSAGAVPRFIRGLSLIPLPYMTVTKQVVVTRCFRPGQRKGKGRKRPSKVFRLPFYRHVPDPNLIYFPKQFAVYGHPTTLDEFAKQLIELDREMAIARMRRVGDLDGSAFPWRGRSAAWGLDVESDGRRACLMVL